LKMRSVWVHAVCSLHPPPLLAARIAGPPGGSMKSRSPQRQSMIRSLTRKEATIYWCGSGWGAIQPLALS